MGNDDQGDDEADEVSGKNSQGAAGIEVAEIVLGSFAVEQNGRDEITGEDKKEIDADPTVAGDFFDGPKEKMRRAADQHKGVIKQDQQDGDPAQSIERVDMPPLAT